MAISIEEAKKIFSYLPDIRFKSTQLKLAADFLNRADPTGIPNHLKEQLQAVDYILSTVDNFKKTLCQEDAVIFRMCFEVLPRVKKSAVAFETNLCEKQVRRRIGNMYKKYADNVFYFPDNWEQLII